jgi:hypothetical protein
MKCCSSRAKREGAILPTGARILPTNLPIWTETARNEWNAQVTPVSVILVTWLAEKRGVTSSRPLTREESLVQPQSRLKIPTKHRGLSDITQPALRFGHSSLSSESGSGHGACQLPAEHAPRVRGRLGR